MREALAGLTVRGRAFVAAGRDGDRLRHHPRPARADPGRHPGRRPAAGHRGGRSAAAATGWRWSAPSTRSWSPPASRRRVSLSLTNEGRTPSGVLLLEDHVPYVLGTRPRFVLEGIGHGWRRHVTYQVRSDVRGQFEIGPMTVRVSDPFGMVELGRAFRTTVPLTVTPRTVPLPNVPLGGAWTGSGDNRPRAFAMGSAEDVTVREYRRGDDLRRVHWRSSAKVGELMVRREEQPWQSRATIFLDNRHARPPRPGHRVLARGRGLGGRVDRGAPQPPRLRRPAGHRRRARTPTAPGTSATPSSTPVRCSRRWPSSSRSRSPGSRPTGWPSRPTAAWWSPWSAASSTTDVPVLRRMQHHAGAPMALALDVDQWVGAPETGGATVAC